MKSLSLSLSTLMIVGLVALIGAPAFAGGQTFSLDPDHTEVHVSWNHFGFSNPGADFVVSHGALVWDAKDPGRSSVSVTIPVASVDTRVPALDARFKSDFFQADKYPVITFKSTGVEQVGLSDHYLVRGKLTLHGVTRPVTLHATLNKVGEHPMLHAPAIGFDAHTVIRRSEFGIGAYIPLVSDRVKIRITTEAVAPEALEKEEKAIRAEAGSKS